MNNIILKKYIPKLFKFLMANGFELSLNNFIHKWFVSLFTQNFNETTSLMIWDFLFLEGNIILFKAALGVFSILKNKIMSNTVFEDIYVVLNDHTLNIKNSREILFFISLRRFEFDDEFLEDHRQLLQKAIIQNIKLENEIKLALKLKNKEKIVKIVKEEPSIPCIKKCNKNWPYCWNDSQNDFQHEIISYLVYKIKSHIVIFDDYFVDKNKFKFNRVNTYKSIGEFFSKNENEDEGNKVGNGDDDLLIQRRPHSRLCKEFNDEFEIIGNFDYLYNSDSKNSTKIISNEDTMHMHMYKRSNIYYDALNKNYLNF
jgi:hypothetical protein